MKVVLDSTVLVSIFSDVDKFHEKGFSIYSDILDKKIDAVIPTLALPETCGVIRRSFGEHAATIVEDQLTTLVDNSMISAKELSIERMKKAVESTIRFSIKGGDAVFVSLAEEDGTPLATFDEKLKKKLKGKAKLYKMS